MAQIIMAEQATPVDPPTGSRSSFFDESDGLLKYVESDGTVVTIGAGAGITTLTGDVTAGPGSGSVAATLAAIQGTPIVITDLANGDVLQYNGTDFVNVPGGGGGGGYDSLTGDGETETPGALRRPAASRSTTTGRDSSSPAPVDLTSLTTGPTRGFSYGSKAPAASQYRAPAARFSFDRRCPAVAFLSAVRAAAPRPLPSA